MTDPQAIDLTKFEKDDRTGHWEVVITLTGEVRETVKADTKEEARAKVEKMITDGEFELMSDEVEDAKIDLLYPSWPMYLVTREGRPMQVSHVQPGDEPRQRDERGF
ncbi:MAG: hypothetical protein ACK4FB_07900 [Brevundimonas sp.]|uniref:hypothetical protein n=1 Tax=Brevundimonas sp. TaxID=1871086 RepID=UPI00391C3548